MARLAQADRKANKQLKQQVFTTVLIRKKNILVHATCQALGLQKKEKDHTGF